MNIAKVILKLFPGDELIENFHDLSHGLIENQRLKIIDQVRSLEVIRDLRKWSPRLLRNRS